mgnify:FL=1
MSILRYLVLMLLSIITLVVFVSAIQGYKASMSKAEILFDNELLSLAQLITSVELPRGMIKQNAQTKFAFQLIVHDQVISRTDNAPTTLINELTPGYKNANFRGDRWRTYTIQVPKIDEKQKTWFIIAQPIKQRFDLAQDIILAAVTPILIVMPLLALTIWLAIREGLKPLNLLTKALKNKKANDLSSLEISSNNELTPVIQTLNELFQRLSATFEREKRFASDAAHELRTPLSVLKINVHNIEPNFHHLVAEQLNNIDAKIQQPIVPFEQLSQSVERMAHVVDQILTLNRTNPEQIFAESEALNLQVLAQECISDLYPDISNRGHEIALNSEKIEILGNRFAIVILLKNLIGNAAKYTPNNGKILVSCLQQEQDIILRVEDSGPGIAVSEYSRVFDRFYRVGGDSHNSNVIGCGLGLSIVKHIVDLHKATIVLSQSSLLKGLSVEGNFLNKNITNKNMSATNSQTSHTLGEHYG